MLKQQDCELVLTGAINGNGNHGASSSDLLIGDNFSSGEAACVLALTTLETAKTHNFSILSTLTMEQSETDGSQALKHPVVRDFAGATGAIEIAQALEQVRQTNRIVTVEWTDQLGIVFAPPSDPVAELPQPQSREQISKTDSITSEWNAAPQTLQQAPIHFYTPSLFAAETELTGKIPPLKTRKILFLVEQSDWWDQVSGVQFLQELNYAIACPVEELIPGAIPIDLSTDETIQESLGRLNLNSYDTIIALKNLALLVGEQLLSVAPTDKLLNLLFAIARQTYPQIQAGKIALATLCLNAWQEDKLNPYTGLLAGLIKSIARELPTSMCKSVSTDTDNLVVALSQVNSELYEAPGKPVEICYRQGKRQIFKLLPLAEVTRNQTPDLDHNSVVVATGGGRGVTAVLMEEVLRRFGCTVVLVGRTDIKAVPTEVLNLDEAGFVRYESEFYRQQLAQNRSTKISALKRQIEFYQAARELDQNLKHLATLPGKIEYVSVNVNDPDEVLNLVERVIKNYGRFDYIVHGAGIQVSKLLPKRSLREFQGILGTKLSGLKHLYDACQQILLKRPVHFHLLTSAFSYIGNDGQPDYGAANEFMNRLAAYLDGAVEMGHWSTLAWLGWAGIGMTRGLEYAVLSQERGLRAIQAHEGQEIFSRLLNGRATAPINVLLTEGEKNYYQIDLSSSTSEGTESLTHSLQRATSVTLPAQNLPQVNIYKEQSVQPQWVLSRENAPYLLDHVVNGIPTMPATFEQEFAVQAARALRPERYLVSIENSSFLRFIKFFNHKEVLLRSEATLVSENDQETLIHVRLISDFVHKSGAILQQDSVHCEMDVRLSSIPQPLISRCNSWNAFDGRRIQEPYMNPLSPVKLSGIFDCLDDLVIGSEYRRARFHLKNTAQLPLLAEFSTPAILIDAMLRLATSSADAQNPLTVFVPQRWEKISLAPNLNDWELYHTHEELFLVGSNSQLKGNELYCEWLQVMTSSGLVLVLMERALGLQKNEQPAQLPQAMVSH